MVLLMALNRPALNASSATPLYEQVASHIATAIGEGVLLPGDRLPAERDLADDWEIGYQTVRHAMAVLRERGLIVSRIGKGTFVSEGPFPGS
jgi:DNA-binding GntR family transcriptional regulator